MNKGSQLSKESGVSAEQGVRGLKWTRLSQLNKESGVSNEQGVPAEQEVRGFKWTRVSAEQGVRGLYWTRGLSWTGVSDEQQTSAERLELTATLSTCCQNLEKKVWVTWKIWEKAGVKLLRDLTEKSVNFSTLATSNIMLLLFFGEEDQ